MTTNTKDGITIRPMTEDDLDTVSDYVINNFMVDEPISGTVDWTKYPKVKEVMKEKHRAMILQGLCLTAIDDSKNGEIVGFCLAAAQNKEDLDSNIVMIERAPPEVAAVLKLGDYMQRKANILELYGVDKVLYSHITFVKSEMRGKQIGTRLAQTLIELGRSQGFKVMTAMCSSFFSGNQKEALGMKIVFQQPYAAYKDDEGKVIFSPPAPHTRARMLAMEL
ncbi:arylalkylamine N-acetyltransferase-like 2 [Drosophila bipectinata]|uniref:arylalkylamine N-acetyltransferase-like 2 n=1 Tax=Drosophila bipectinata TaxID=42026 RepID=UPI001C8ADE1A|nr:arylalkylamine N-acetyltransferase-like 2 [Drosophila bipectinata]